MSNSALREAVRGYLTAKSELKAAREDWRDADASKFRAEMETAEAEMAVLAMR